MISRTEWGIIEKHLASPFEIRRLHDVRYVAVRTEIIKIGDDPKYCYRFKAAVFRAMREAAMMRGNVEEAGNLEEAEREYLPLDQRNRDTPRSNHPMSSGHNSKPSAVQRIIPVC